MAFTQDLEAVILGILQGGGKHGYDLAKRIREIDRGALNAREGRLYPLLHRLEVEGQIAGQWVPQEGRPPRKVYHLTAMGWDALADHRRAWEQYVGSIDSAIKIEASPEDVTIHG